MMMMIFDDDDYLRWWWWSLINDSKPRCIEPSTSCRAGAPPHQESTLQQVEHLFNSLSSSSSSWWNISLILMNHHHHHLDQVTVRGPLHIVQAPRNSLHTGLLPSSKQVKTQTFYRVWKWKFIEDAKQWKFCKEKKDFENESGYFFKVASRSRIC